MSALPVWCYQVPWLTVRQPWADLLMAGVKDPENRTWPPPSTLPQWWRCERCNRRVHASTLPDWWTPDTRHNCRAGADVVACALDGGGRVVADGPFPFLLGIYAAAKPDAPGTIDLTDEVREPWEALPWYDGWLHGDAMPYGALLGSVEVTGCHHANDCTHPPYTPGPWSYCSRWALPNHYHWTPLTNPQPLPEPIPWKGRQGLWRIAPEAAA